MLENINPLLKADLLQTLASMGHGDLLALVDRNFPDYSHSRRVVRLDAVRAPKAAEAVVSVFPVDTLYPRRSIA